ncbi:hypothetical protein HF669_08590 [Acidithiobacillus thiooxidans]|uniref:hypothetical protein n=1 Tax=Acidithiobacillus thiooxidans TaxID=930 RepID=UPI001C07E56F|nr:hypothetical protein [Acidithiobacillus thiooxidans]MBU2811424.1 hypothetical protein [Acidithiobacillus thiooxidans]
MSKLQYGFYKIPKNHCNNLIFYLIVKYVFYYVESLQRSVAVLCGGQVVLLLIRGCTGFDSDGQEKARTGRATPPPDMVDD